MIKNNDITYIYNIRMLESEFLESSYDVSNDGYKFSFL